MGSIYRRRHFKKGKIIQGHVWWIQYPQAGKKIRKSAGSTKMADAQKPDAVAENLMAAN